MYDVAPMTETQPSPVSTAAIQNVYARFDTFVLTPFLVPLLAFNVTQQRLGIFHF